MVGSHPLDFGYIEGKALAACFWIWAPNSINRDDEGGYISKIALWGLTWALNRPRSISAG